ncbi:MAG: restriction endonuclease subunit S [Clostridiales bacterium]|nr:restriction endonuclease subunit S [Clostridiales bacterium]
MIYRNHLWKALNILVGSNGIIGYHNKYTTEAPSITIGRSGNVGKPYIYYGKTWSHNTTLYIKEYKNTDPIFIYYFLKTLDLGSYAGGSAVSTLNRNHIHTLLVKVPCDISEQRKIGAFLKMFDDTIENNERINKNLEQQAQVIFESWFINYEPWHGEAPASWLMGKLGDFTDIKRGGSPRPIQKYLSDSGLRWLKISDVTSLQTLYVINIKDHIMKKD